MEKLNVIFVEDPKGGYTGFLKDRPEVITEGETYVEVLQNLIDLVKSVEEFEKK